MYIPKSQRPYIGITDFMSKQEVEYMLNVFRTHRREGSPRRLHVGVMMSFKTLYGYETKWTKAFPNRGSVGQIFYPIGIPGSSTYQEMNDDLMRTLHYADYENSPDLFKNLTDALQYAGPFVGALQLDMIWPDPSAIANAMHASRREAEIILQIGKNALEEAHDNPDEVVERLYPYHTFITHVLLDKSMGKGLGMDAEGLLPFARAIRKEYPNIGLAVAGGLGPQTMHLVEPLVAEFPDISIGAQERLPLNGSTLDPIDRDRASEYLVKALALLK